MKKGAAVRIGGILAAAFGGAALYTRIATKRIEQEVPVDGTFIDVPGARLHYVDRGSGPTIVMLHGMGAQLRNYSYGVADALAGDSRVILVDRPGSGYSTPTGDQLGILGQAATIAALIERLELDRPLLVGHSLAGAIALGVATHHPGTIAGLALLAPMTQPSHMMPAPLAGVIEAARVGRMVFANLLGTPLSRAAFGLRWRTIFAPDPVPEDFATRGGGALGDRPISMNAATVELASADKDIAAIVARYGALNVPVALLYGREDQVVDPAVDGERAVDAIPGATLEMTDGGHMLPVAHPEVTASFIRAVAPTGHAVKMVALPAGTLVPALGQGTWMMAEQAGRRRDEIAALREGIDLGMTLIDTAEMYADGESERLVGEAIAGRRDDVFLVSKAYPQNASRARLRAACEASLKRLGTDRLDLYLLHWRGSVPLGETVAAMEELCEAGLILRWGVSNLDTADMEELIAASGEGCATDQILYNLTRRGPELDLLPWLASHNMPAMAYSPVEQGRLVRHPELSAVAATLGTTAARLALAWTLRQGGVITIPKAGTVAHVRDNRAALDLVLDDTTLARLDAEFARPRTRQPLAML